MQAAATALLAKQHRHSLRKCTSSAQIAPPSLLTLLAASWSLPAAVTNDGQCLPTIPGHPPILELASMSPDGGGPLQNTVSGEVEPVEALQCAVSWVKGRMQDISKGFGLSREAGVKYDTEISLAVHRQVQVVVPSFAFPLRSACVILRAATCFVSCHASTNSTSPASKAGRRTIRPARSAATFPGSLRPRVHLP